MAYTVFTRNGKVVNIRELPSIHGTVLKQGSGKLGEFEGNSDKDNQGYTWYKIEGSGWVREDVALKKEQIEGELKVKVTRVDNSDIQSLGLLTVFDMKTNNIIFTCKTLELPDKNNASNISCIPTGVYECEMTYSNAFKKQLYLIKDVPNRAGVRIHAANYVGQLRGCIALGSMHKDINADQVLDLVHSGNTMKKFQEIMQEKPFTLEIA